MTDDPAVASSPPVTSGPPVRSAPSSPSRKRIWIARGIAVAADAIQIVIFPVFAEGFASPLNIGLDVAVFIVMVALLGWHLAFLPGIVTEIIPGLDLFPTWTTAVLFATRRRK